MSLDNTDSRSTAKTDWSLARPEEVERQRNFTERGPFREKFLAFGQDEILTVFPRNKNT